MIHRPLSWILDGVSGSTFLLGIVTGQNIAIFLGGMASIMAFINHLNQFLDRQKNKKK